MSISENLKDIEERIQKACDRAGRKREEVTLICVSKTKPVSAVEEAYSAGQRNFGENKVQEILDKAPALPEDIKWHMIGHLQRNKVKQVIERAALIHSVDSFRLAEEINIQALKRGITVPILMEVNAAGEESKFGVSVEDAFPLAEQISELKGLRLCGLMTVAPYVAVSEENRPVFRRIRQLAVDIDSQNIDNISMDRISMGMTGDFETAIEEGATLIRVGTGVFGERQYQNGTH